MKQIFTILFIFFMCSTWSFAQTFTADGTLTIPTMDGALCIDEMDITVQAWGAGGGSASGATNNRAGGGGGAYFEASYTVAAGASFPIIVGLGVTAQAGGATSFDFGGGPVIVGGGDRGVNQPGAGGVVSGAGAGGGTATAGGAGGSRGNTTSGGGGGGSGPGATAGSNGTNGGAGGMGGTAGGGNGGAETVGGSPGGFPGGGAGGKGDNTDPANTYTSIGGNGQVIVTLGAFTTIVCPLSVELVRFNAKAKDKHILLEWQTATELNNKGFEIQKSKDGQAWEMIELVEGNGTAFTSNTYTFTDRFPTQGSNYYRLKQMDFDGRFEYSETVFADFNRLNELVVFPNPAQDQLTLINGQGEAIIYNALGQAVKQLTIGANQATIQLSDLLNGQHYLQVIQEDGAVVTKQFSKMN